MSIATLSFKLPKEKDEYMIALNGGNFLSTIVEMDNYLRNILKYNSDKYKDIEICVFEDVRNKLSCFIEENEIRNLVS